MRIGTSGWQYRDWRPGFYPAKLPQKSWLEYYASQFQVVEINNAFYRLPERDTFAQWRDRTPDDFEFAVKMSRYLTHVKRLKEPEEPVARFLGRAEALGSKLGPVLIQLPPNLPVDLTALETTLAQFPSHVRVAVEPRHESWWTGEVEDLLRKNGAALVWADRHSRPLTPRWRTADFAYLRMHEGRAKPWPRYGPSALRTWTTRLGSPESYVFFNNDPGRAAIVDATAMAATARRAGRKVTRTP
jgi:uncharacterized protein YecE (DUF72 family)